MTKINEMFDKAKEMFLEIYDEYINSEGCKRWLQERNKALKILNEENKSWNEMDVSKIDEDTLCIGPSHVVVDFPDYSLDREKYDMKMSLLKAHLKVDDFPSDWYHHKNCKGSNKFFIPDDEYVPLDYDHILPHRFRR